MSRWLIDFVNINGSDEKQGKLNPSASFVPIGSERALVWACGGHALYDMVREFNILCLSPCTLTACTTQSKSPIVHAQPVFVDSFLNAWPMLSLSTFTQCSLCSHSGSPTPGLPASLPQGPQRQSSPRSRPACCSRCSPRYP